MIRLMTIDDSQVVRDFIGFIVKTAPDIELVAQADTGASALATIDSTDVDVAIVDLGLPDIDGHDLLDLLVAEDRYGLIVLSAGVGHRFGVNYPDIVAFDKLRLFDERERFFTAIRAAAAKARPRSEIRLGAGPGARAHKVSLRR